MVMRDGSGADGAIENAKDREPHFRNLGAGDNPGTKACPNVVHTKFQDRAHRTAKDNRSRVEYVYERDDTSRKLAGERTNGLYGMFFTRLGPACNV